MFARFSGRLNEALETENNKLTNALVTDSTEGQLAWSRELAGAWFRQYVEGDGIYITEEEALSAGLRWFRDARSEQANLVKLRAEREELERRGLGGMLREIFRVR